MFEVLGYAYGVTSININWLDKPVHVEQPKPGDVVDIAGDSWRCWTDGNPGLRMTMVESAAQRAERLAMADLEATELDASYRRQS